MLLNEVIGQDLSGMDTQQFQNFELVLSKMDLLTVQYDLVLGDVHGHIFDMIDVLLRAAAQLQSISSAQCGTDAGQ